MSCDVGEVTERLENERAAHDHKATIYHPSRTATVSDHSCSTWPSLNNNSLPSAVAVYMWTLASTLHSGLSWPVMGIHLTFHLFGFSFCKRPQGNVLCGRTTYQILREKFVSKLGFEPQISCKSMDGSSDELSEELVM